MLYPPKLGSNTEAYDSLSLKLGSTNSTRGVHLRPEIGMLSKCSWGMYAMVNKFQAQHRHEALSAGYPREGVDFVPCQLWRTCQVSCRLNPTFHSQISTRSLIVPNDFFVSCCPCKRKHRKHHCKKWSEYPLHESRSSMRSKGQGRGITPLRQAACAGAASVFSLSRAGLWRSTCRNKGYVTVPECVTVRECVTVPVL